MKTFIHHNKKKNVWEGNSNLPGIDTHVRYIYGTHADFRNSFGLDHAIFVSCLMYIPVCTELHSI